LTLMIKKKKTCHSLSLHLYFVFSQRSTLLPLYGGEKYVSKEVIRVCYTKCTTMVDGQDWSK
jgi:hypothetical protein